MSIEKRLILYPSQRYQLPLQTTIKYGLMTPKIKYVPDINSRKSQERIIRGLGRKYIQGVSYETSWTPRENTRMISRVTKLPTLKKIDIKASSLGPKILLFARRLCSKVFSRSKHIKSATVTGMDSSTPIVPLVFFYEPLLLLKAAEQLNLPQIDITHPDKLHQLSRFLSLAHKRKIWPVLKTLLSDFHTIIRDPVQQEVADSLKSALHILEDPTFSKVNALGFNVRLLSEDPPRPSDFEFMKMVLKSRIVSNIEITIKGKMYERDYTDYFNLFQEDLQLKQIFLLNFDVPSNQEELSLIPTSLDQLKLLKSLRLYLSQVNSQKSPKCLANTFDVVAKLNQLQTLNVEFGNNKLDGASLKVISDSIRSLKSLQSLSLTCGSLALQNPDEISNELKVFMKNIGTQTSLKEIKFDWRELQQRMNVEHLQLFFQSLQNLSELRTLKVDFSRLPANEDCIQELIKCFSVCTKLESLDLRVNISEPIPAETLIKWIQSIKKLKNLTDFILDFTVHALTLTLSKALDYSIESLKSLNYSEVKVNSLQVAEKDTIVPYFESLAEKLRIRMKVGNVMLWEDGVTLYYV